MINSIKLVFYCFYFLFRPLFKGFLKLRQKYKNIFVGFLVQMKTLKFAFEINWPLGAYCPNVYIVPDVLNEECILSPQLTWNGSIALLHKKVKRCFSHFIAALIVHM